MVVSPQGEHIDQATKVLPPVAFYKTQRWLLGNAWYRPPDPELLVGDPSFHQERVLSSQRERLVNRLCGKGGHSGPAGCTSPCTYPPQSPSSRVLGVPPLPLLPPTGPITSKGSPRVSGNTLDTSSWPHRPPWKALPTTVALENRGLTWKAMSPESVKKLISNLWVESVVRIRSVAGGSQPQRGRLLLVFSSICMSLHSQAPARGQTPCTEGFELKSKHRGQSPRGLQPPSSPPSVLFIQGHPLPPSPRPPLPCCSGCSGPTLPPQPLCLGAEEKL